MNDQLAVFNFKSMPVRTSLQNGEIWFCLVDICKILRINDRCQLRKRLNERGMGLIPTPSRGGTQKTYYINEANLYRAILRSDKPEAIEFENWVCEKVLPAIRVKGYYCGSDNRTDLVEVREHKRARPSGKKEIILSDKAKTEIGGIVKRCTASVFDEKLPKIAQAFPSKKVGEIIRATEQRRKKDRVHEYKLTDAEEKIIKSIRSMHLYTVMDYYLAFTQVE